MSKHQCALCGQQLTIEGRRAGRICKTCLERERLEHRVRMASERSSLGARVADRMSAIGGSWSFVFGFLIVLAAWMAFNSLTRERFDPYPYILLNLGLSALAAIQAPIIMMSQNRLSERDRAQAEEDFHTNLKAELEIASLHEKLDQVLHTQLEQLVDMHRSELALLQELVARSRPLAGTLQR